MSRAAYAPSALFGEISSHARLGLSGDLRSSPRGFKPRDFNSRDGDDDAILGDRLGDGDVIGVRVGVDDDASGDFIGDGDGAAPRVGVDFLGVDFRGDGDLDARSIATFSRSASTFRSLARVSSKIGARVSRNPLRNVSSPNRSVRRLARVAISSRSSSGMRNAFAMAAAKSSSDVARNPTSRPGPSPTTMSMRGPALSCAMGIAPDAMYSTTHMPKCSSSIVCNPARAPASNRRISE